MRSNLLLLNFNSCGTGPIIKYNNQIMENYQLNNINMLISPDTYLISSILLETLSTTLLKKVLENKLWYIPVYSGYAISFYIFPKALEKYQLSVAYSLWCGFGIILTTLIDKIFYKEIITFKKFIGMLIIIMGIKYIK